MKIVKSCLEMKNLSVTYQKSGKTIGFVPTMGALHSGHISLLNRVQEMCDCSVMSIFVNPAQFGPKEDFKNYPRPFDEDCIKAEAAGCDILFAPSKEDMYPEHYCTYVNVENITDTLCGASRQGHFRGVTTVVLKFFNIVNPQIAVFGQKDAQQVVVLKRMVHDLNMSINIDVAPIIREPDGLAMSSRNVYLTPGERQEASGIYRGLLNAMLEFEKGEKKAPRLLSIIRNEYEKFLLIDTEYIEIVDTIGLRSIEEIGTKALIAVACRTKESRTRLIDNIVVGGNL
jgi:pantoate--beta-alanine ligase